MKGDGVVEVGLPPAHVGLHAGPVVFQEGDYTADLLEAGEVLAAVSAGPTRGEPRLR